MIATGDQILRLNGAGKDKKGNRKEGKAAVLHIAKADWPQATPPREGRLYKVRGEKHRDSLFTVTALAVVKVDGGWDVTVRKGDLRDVPRLLRARPNHEIEEGTGETEDDDYTSQPRLAMSNEPEAVPEVVARGYGHAAVRETKASRDRLLREAREHAAQAAALLEEAGGTTLTRTARSIMHHIDKVAPGESKAA